MMYRKNLLGLVIASSLLVISGCKESSAPTSSSTTSAPATSAASKKSVDEFIADVNKQYETLNKEVNAAQWVYVTYINDDTALLATKASEKMLEANKVALAEARQYQSQPMSATTAKAYANLTKGQTLLPPDSAEDRAELAAISTKMEGAYGAGKYCKEVNGEKNCRDLEQLSDVLATSRNFDELVEAWTGWRTVAPSYRQDYQRFVELANKGARAYGFKDLGDSWRSGYDMPIDQFAPEVERLWRQVEPLYKQLHCKVRRDLSQFYGADKVPLDQPIPAQLLGDMWSQTWGNIYDIVQPYPGVGDLDVTGALVKQKKSAVEIAKIAEGFFVSLGLRKLPDSFWDKSMLTKPRDREVVCHASAWAMDGKEDVRIKQCIVPNEEEFETIHHELGHIYYDLSYNQQPMLFQNGAHDGFHEAIGDTIALSITPSYLKAIGLIDKTDTSDKAVINQQMKMALNKIAFLPFGKLIDQWRWQVFSGEIKPEDYNKAWWQLRTQYQGIRPPVARSEADFDPGSKYHIASNTPYTRYFLSFILQFQFHKALCDAAGFNGPLYACSIYNNKAAGAKLQKLLEAGASKPWQDTLEEAIGTRQMDASAIIEYFAPLMAWLEKENQGQACGW